MVNNGPGSQPACSLPGPPSPQSHRLLSPQSSTPRKIKNILHSSADICGAFDELIGDSDSDYYESDSDSDASEYVDDSDVGAHASTQVTL